MRSALQSSPQARRGYEPNRPDPTRPSILEGSEETGDAQNLDTMPLHFAHETKIALDVVIAGDEIFGRARNRGFELDIVVRISAEFHRADNRYNGRSGSNESQVLRNLLVVYPILLLDAGTSKHVADLFKNRQRHDHFDRVIAPCSHSAGGQPVLVEQSRNPDVRVKQSDGFHAV